jgi:hypothetical protein
MRPEDDLDRAPEVDSEIEVAGLAAVLLPQLGQRVGDVGGDLAAGADHVPEHGEQALARAVQTRAQHLAMIELETPGEGARPDPAHLLRRGGAQEGDQALDHLGFEAEVEQALGAVLEPRELFGGDRRRRLEGVDPVVGVVEDDSRSRSFAQCVAIDAAIDPLEVLLALVADLHRCGGAPEDAARLELDGVREQGAAICWLELHGRAEPHEGARGELSQDPHAARRHPFIGMLLPLERHARELELAIGAHGAVFNPAGELDRAETDRAIETLGVGDVRPKLLGGRPELPLKGIAGGAVVVRAQVGGHAGRCASPRVLDRLEERASVGNALVGSFREHAVEEAHHLVVDVGAMTAISGTGSRRWA